MLIHAGAGGVGLAAIQLAHAAGAEVFATASLPKQKFLRSMGVECVYDSRTTAFGQEVLEATGGEGVHVLLNSLTGEGFIEANLSCLGTGGRFVEISKRSIWGEEEMATSRPDVAYSILDLDDMIWSDPVRAGAFPFPGHGAPVGGRVDSSAPHRLAPFRDPISDGGNA